MSRPTSFHLIISFWWRLNSVSVTRRATGECSPFVGYNFLSLLFSQSNTSTFTSHCLSEIVHWQLQLHTSKWRVRLALPGALQERHMLRRHQSVYPGHVYLFFIPIMHGARFHTNQVHLQMSCLCRGLSDRRGRAGSAASSWGLWNWCALSVPARVTLKNQNHSASGPVTVPLLINLSPQPKKLLLTITAES